MDETDVPHSSVATTGLRASPNRRLRSDDQVRVHVPGQHHAAADAVVGERVEQPVASRVVPVPAVRAPAPAAAEDPGRARDHGLLGQEVPATRDGAQAVLEPALLRHAQHRAAWREQLPAAAIDESGAAAAGPRARLRRAELPAVEDVEARQRADVEARAEKHRAAGRPGRLRQRHVLEVGAVRGRAAVQELRIEALRAVARVVVVDLVVVPRDQPGHGGVQPLEIRVGLVLGVARSGTRRASAPRRRRGCGAARWRRSTRRCSRRGRP